MLEKATVIFVIAALCGVSHGISVSKTIGNDGSVMKKYTRRGPKIVSGLEIFPGDDLKGERGPAGPPGPPGAVQTAGGASYIRWGRTECPKVNGTELVYKGVAAGASHGHRGGGANYLCLPEDPQYLEVTAGGQGQRELVYGTEYQFNEGNILRSLLDYDVPCASCFTAKRGTEMMIPARTECYPGWTREYNGYLVSSQHGQHRVQYECLDVDAQGITGSSKNVDGSLMYLVEVVCHGSIPCAANKYVSRHELACVVCTI